MFRKYEVEFAEMGQICDRKCSQHLLLLVWVYIEVVYDVMCGGCTIKTQEMRQEYSQAAIDIDYSVHLGLFCFLSEAIGHELCPFKNMLTIG